MHPEQATQNNLPEESESEASPEEVLTEKLTDIQKAVEQKFGLKCPPLTWDIFFGHHNTTQDFEEFIASADNPDVFVMENAGWLEGTLELYRKISAGEEPPEKMDKFFGAHRNDFSMAFADWIYGKKLPVVSLETTNEKNTKKISDIHQKFTRFVKKLDDVKNDVDYQQAVSGHSALFQEWALAETVRENEIIDNIPERIAELLQTNPKLQEKDNLKIKMFYGSFHTTLSHQLSDGGENVSREFQQENMPYDVSVQALRYYRFGKTLPPDLEEKILFLELINHDEIQNKFLPPEEIDKPPTQVDVRIFLDLRRKILAAMSIGDIKHYYELRKNASPEERLAYVKSFLEKNKEN